MHTQNQTLTACDAALDRLDAGVISAPVALMEMLLAVEDAARVAETVRARRSPGARAVSALMAKNEAGCARIAAMLRSGVDAPPHGASVEEGVAFCKRLFDWSVAQSEEASVALYSLGSPELLSAATGEIRALFRAWGVLGPRCEALDLGCGIGRMAQALAGDVARVHGVDVSEAMIAAARRRCAGLANVSLSVCSGLDLRELADARFDLVFAVDSFPYVVQAGMPLAGAYFAEVSRVLREGGSFVVLDFSYRGDLEADRADVSALATLHGFEITDLGTSPFALWNGHAFRMIKR